MSSSSVPVAGNGTYTSAAVVVSLPGNYHWTSSYGGDADNAPRASACNAPAAAVNVAPPPLLSLGGAEGPAGSTGLAAGASGGAGSTAQPPKGLRLGGFKLTPSVFTRGSVKGTTVKYWLSGPAGVRFVVERATMGRRSNATCVKPSAKLEQSARCTRYVRVTTIERTYKNAGSRILRFSGRLNRRPLPAGSYRVRARRRAARRPTRCRRRSGSSRADPARRRRPRAALVRGPRHARRGRARPRPDGLGHMGRPARRGAVSEGSRRVAVIVEPAHPARIAPLLMSAYGLTEREQDVTRLVLQGESTTAIAERLVVSAHTVQQHLKSIFEKTGVHSRRDLVGKVFFSYYEPRVRDNESRVPQEKPLRGGPLAPPDVSACAAGTCP